VASTHNPSRACAVGHTPPSTARGDKLVNTLPDDLTGFDAQSCTIDGLVASCDLGDLPCGAVVTVPFSGRVRGEATGDTVLVDNAMVSAAGDPAASKDNAKDQMVVVAPPPPPATAFG
jgi:hypothetical protein